jgi:hypothetical protein
MSRLLVVTVAPSRIIRRRVVVGERAAERALVAHLAVADARREPRERGHRHLHVSRRRDFGVTRHRADHDVAADGADALELGQIAEIDQRGVFREPQLQRREQALAAGDEFRVGEFAHKRCRLLDA